MRSVQLAALITTGLFAVGGAAGCATKGHVADRVGEVNDRVDDLSVSVEDTRNQTERNAARLAEVDETAMSAKGDAARAHNRADEAAAMADVAREGVDALDRASRRLVFEVVLDESAGSFAFNQTALPDDAKVALDALVERLKADPKNVYLEIEGHTDATGPGHVNERIGLERAEAVKWYLYEEHRVPLHKMNIISFGEDKPVAPNDTREGRAQNRRVVIKALS